MGSTGVLKGFASGSCAHIFSTQGRRASRSWSGLKVTFWTFLSSLTGADLSSSFLTGSATPGSFLMPGSSLTSISVLGSVLTSDEVSMSTSCFISLLIISSLICSNLTATFSPFPLTGVGCKFSVGSLDIKSLA